MKKIDNDISKFVMKNHEKWKEKETWFLLTKRHILENKVQSIINSIKQRKQILNYYNDLVEFEYTTKYPRVFYYKLIDDQKEKIKEKEINLILLKFSIAKFDIEINFRFQLKKYKNKNQSMEKIQQLFFS